MCYACYQRSQLAVTKQLQSEVAHLKGEITKLSEQLAKLATASLSEATVSQPGVIKFWGPHENGDAGSPFLL